MASHHRVGIALSMFGALGALGGIGACRRAASHLEGGTGSPVGSTLGSTVGSTVLATVAGTPIRAEDVALEMRARGGSARDALDALVTFELLARAAVDARVDADVRPTRDDRDALRAIQVQRLLERELEPRLTPEAIPESELRALYQRGIKRFVHGRIVQVAVLCVFTGARMKPEARARAQETARRLKAFVDELADKTPAAFEATARDPSWSDRKVTATTVWQTEDDPFPAVVGRAAATLGRPGDTTDLVGDETGYYITRYIAEAPPRDIAFAAAAAELRAELYQPWRRQTFLRLSTELAAGHDVEVLPEALQLLAAESAASP